MKLIAFRLKPNYAMFIDTEKKKTKPEIASTGMSFPFDLHQNSWIECLPNCIKTSRSEMTCSGTWLICVGLRCLYTNAQ